MGNPGSPGDELSENPESVDSETRRVGSGQLVA